MPAGEVLAAYRLRRQVEFAFKRLKGLLGLDRLPAKNDALARSWLLAHLILALLIDEAARDHLPDSPPARKAGHQRPVSLWRLDAAPRDALLLAARGTLTLARLHAARAVLARHLHERPRRRAGQLLTARRHAPP